MLVNQEGRKAFDRFIEEFLDNPFKDINERIEKGRTVLHYGAQLSDVGIVRLLIEQGANVNARDDRGETALHIAAFAGKAKNAKALIENGAEVNARSNNKAVPLHLACLARRVKTIEVLINAEGDVNAIDKFGCSPLNYAKIYPKVTSFLEKKGVNMRNVAVKPGKAKAALDEIMEKCDRQGVNGFEMDFKEEKKLILEEFSLLGKEEKIKTMKVVEKLCEIAEKTENALSRLNLKEKGERRFEEIREKLEEAPLVEEALREVEKELEDIDEKIKEL